MCSRLHCFIFFSVPDSGAHLAVPVMCLAVGNSAGQAPSEVFPPPQPHSYKIEEATLSGHCFYVQSLSLSEVTFNQYKKEEAGLPGLCPAGTLNGAV